MGPLYEPTTIVYAEPLDAYTSFTLDLLERSDFGKKNNIVSPLSIYIALLMLTEGSNGDTKEELLNALHIASLNDSRTWFNNLLEDVLDVREPARTSIANSVWIQEEFPINDEYINVLEKFYFAEARLVDFVGEPFQATKAINKWIKNKTYGLIKEVISPGDIDEATRIVLVNTLYFYAEWLKPFEEIVPGDFYSCKGVINIDYMKSTMDIHLLDTHEFLAIALSYKGTDIKFVIVMPKDGDLENFTNNLSKDKLLNIFEDLLSSTEVSVELYLPKFDIDSGSMSYKKILQDMGIRKVFDPRYADLSPMVESRERILYVKDVLHRARVRVDLKGTEAAAATAVVMVLSAVMQPPKIIKINKPFMFFLLEPDNNAILFAGSIIDPSSLQ